MSHYVYVIGTVQPDCTLGSPVKVGITANPYGRLSTIKTSCPNPVEFAHLFQTRTKDAAVILERAAHKLWEGASLNGEWFDTDPDSIAQDISDTIESAIIDTAAKERKGLSFITEKIIWTGVDQFKKRAAATRYKEAWEWQSL